MKILITGATGLVGTKLVETLILQGHDDIRILSTNKKRASKSIPFPVDIKKWNPLNSEIEENSLDDVDIIFHLAGESVADGRWSQERKERILKSRTLGTQILLNEIRKSNTTPTKFISSSAVGIYGNTHDRLITTESKLGEGFLAEVCKQWEGNLYEHNIDGMIAHVMRTGIVLSLDGGALTKMLPPFKMGAGGRLGSGKQYMSWIHIDDLVNAFIYLMENECRSFAYNGVAPTPVTNTEFTKVLGRVLKRPTISPVPSFMLKLLFGEMSDILLEGQNVVPNNLIKDGLKFKFEKLDDALENILQFDNKGEVQFKRYQWVNESTDKVFSFFSEAKNLESITPSYLNFKIEAMSTAKIEAGSLIDYKLKIHGFPAKWKSKISKFEEGKSFIDEQVSGPYKKWVHQHDFTPIKNGTLISDTIVYKVPLGSVGNIFAGWFIRRDVNSIFNFRNKVIKETF